MQIEGGIVILEEHVSVRILEGEGGGIFFYIVHSLTSQTR